MNDRRHLEHQAYKERFAERHAVREQYNPTIALHFESARAYANIAISSSLVLNGGALFALPAYIAALRTEGVALPAGLIAISASMFMFGILTAAACSILAYFNQLNFSVAEHCQRDADLVLIDDKYDIQARIRQSGKRAHDYDFYIAEKAMHERRADKLFRPAVIVGVASYLFFTAGSIVGGGAMLAVDAGPVSTQSTAVKDSTLW